jgi:hypothetical protein
MTLLVDISYVKIDEAPIAAEVATSAMHEDVISRALFGFAHQVERSNRFNRNVLELACRNPDCRVFKAVLKNTSEVVGIASMQFRRAEWNSEAPLDVPLGDADESFAKALYSKLASSHTKQMTGKEHVSEYPKGVIYSYF